MLSTSYNDIFCSQRRGDDCTILPQGRGRLQGPRRKVFTGISGFDPIRFVKIYNEIEEFHVYCKEFWLLANIGFFTISAPAGSHSTLGQNFVLKNAIKVNLGVGGQLFKIFKIFPFQTILKRKTLIFGGKFRKCIEFLADSLEKFGPIEQHKPQISENSFLKCNRT